MDGVAHVAAIPHIGTGQHAHTTASAEVVATVSAIARTNRRHLGYSVGSGGAALMAVDALRSERDGNSIAHSLRDTRRIRRAAAAQLPRTHRHSCGSRDRRA